MSEERYHLRHADALLDALAGESDAGGARRRRARPRCCRSASALFDDPIGRRRGGRDRRRAAALRASPRSGGPLSTAGSGSRDWAAVEPVAQAGRTVRSGSFATVYADMREVIMLDPDATW